MNTNTNMNLNTNININIYKIQFDRDDGIIAMIHSQGSVDSVEYNNIGTSISCRVPDALFSRLQSYKEKTRK